MSHTVVYLKKFPKFNVETGYIGFIRPVRKPISKIKSSVKSPHTQSGEGPMTLKEGLQQTKEILVRTTHVERNTEGNQ